MCGRFTLANEDWSFMLDYFGLPDNGFRYPPTYNRAPGQDTPAVISDGKQRRIGVLNWGLIPSWSETEKTSFKTINARAETLTTKPAFKNLITRKRCIIPADGFYEWRRHDKQPFRIRVKDREVFGFAGLYDTWVSPDGKKKVSSCTIITCKPNMFMASIHDRMPVILARDAEDLWLERDLTDVNEVMSVLQPYPDREMYAYKVSPIVGNVRNQGPECIEAID